jgi:hypothetical protein
MKIYRKKITEFLPASSTKKSVQIFFSVLQEKFVCFKFPCMVGLSPGEITLFVVLFGKADFFFKFV